MLFCWLVYEMDMLTLIKTWLAECTSHLAPATKRGYEYHSQKLATSLQGFDPRTVRCVDIYRAIQPQRNTPRTYNQSLSLIREWMRLAIVYGLRDDNPTQHIRGLKCSSRTRYITDSELRRIKAAAIRQNGKRSRAGENVCAIIDMAYLTGQRLGDLVRLKWSNVTTQGVRFETRKTGSKILIQYTPKLKTLISRLQALSVGSEYVFSQTTCKPYAPGSVSYNWINACKTAGITDAHFHDVRAKAITDKYLREGLEQAHAMGAHCTQWNTMQYVKRHKTLVTSATL